MDNINPQRPLTIGPTGAGPAPAAPNNGLVAWPPAGNQPGVQPGAQPVQPTAQPQPPVAPGAQPQQPMQPQAQPTLPTDQYRPAPNAPAPRDPQVLAALAVYGLQLGSSKPVDISQAIMVFENAGPAYRPDAIALIKQHLSPTMDPLAAQSMLDALIRWKATDAVPQVQMLMQSVNPRLQEVGKKAYLQLAGLPGGIPDPLAQGSAPYVPGQPAPTPAAANTPGGAPQAPNNPNAPLPQDVLKMFLDGLKDRKTMPSVAVEIAKLSGPQVAQILTAAANDRSIYDDRIFDLLTASVGNHIHDPGCVDAMRVLLNRPGNLNSIEMSRAQGRAALALLNFGAPTDVPAFLRYMAQPYYVHDDMRKVLIDQLAQRPQLMNNQAVVLALGAVANDLRANQSAVAAAHALSLIPTAAARDALGEARVLRDANGDQIYWALTYLDKHPAPYSQGTIDNLRYLLKSGDKNIKDKATALLRKTGVSP